MLSSFRKLIIQIPCLNEAGTLSLTLKDLPRHVPGFDAVEWLVVDDGSTDGTAEIAAAAGVDHIVSLGYHQGLARAFMIGLEQSLKLGADVIVNTDADNQYSARCIPELVRPILERRALVVVGARPISDIQHFSLIKKALQRIGSWVVQRVSQTDIEDAPSGFRAIHRDAAMQLNVFGRYTYTLETIIQAGRKNIPIVSIPVQVNPDLRPSRLVKSLAGYVARSSITILRIFIVYKPFRFFLWIAVALAVPALFFIFRFLLFYVAGEGNGHIQSLLLASGLLVLSGLAAMSGILADLIATNRTLLEDVRTRLFRIELARKETGASHLMKNDARV